MTARYTPTFLPIPAQTERKLFDGAERNLYFCSNKQSVAMKNYLSNLSSHGEEPAFFPMNDPLEALIRQLECDVIRVRYFSEITGQTEEVRGTLMGYWYAFGHRFRYVPRQTFLPLFDMDRHRWITLRADSVIFEEAHAPKAIKDPTAKKAPKDTIIVHCSATYPGQDVGMADIDRWHRERGFDGIGYHYVIRLDGTIEEGRPYDRDGAHALGWNHRAVGICYIGGYDDKGRPADTRTPQQRSALIRLIIRLKQEHPTLVRVLGHRDVARKECPCFDAAEEYSF